MSEVLEMRWCRIFLPSLFSLEQGANDVPADILIRLLAGSLMTVVAGGGVAWTQPVPGGPPAVGIVEAITRPITRAANFLGGSRRSIVSTSSRASPRFWKNGCTVIACD